MTIYNRYFAMLMPIVGLGENDMSELGWDTLFRGIWSTGHLLSQYTFPAPSQTQKPVHPLGMGGEWSVEDADITKAVVVSLSASSKTGRAFAWHSPNVLQIQDL